MCACLRRLVCARVYVGLCVRVFTYACACARLRRLVRARVYVGLCVRAFT